MLRTVLLAPTSQTQAPMLMLAAASDDSTDVGRGDKTDSQPSPKVEKASESSKAKPAISSPGAVPPVVIVES